MPTVDRTPPHFDDPALTAFHRLPVEEMRRLMCEAGALGEPPALGDRVGIQDEVGDWRFAVVVGVTRTPLRLTAVHNVDDVVQVTSLHAFSHGDAVELVNRAPSDLAVAAAAHALALVGQRFDLANFRYDAVPPYDGVTLDEAAARHNLDVTPDAVRSDPAWQPSKARYRDGRRRFAGP